MSQKTENIAPDRLKVWYDPHRKWFIAFTPDGNEIREQMNISISDDIESKKTIATINVYVDVVNEPPKIDPKINEIERIQKMKDNAVQLLELGIKGLKGLF